MRNFIRSLERAFLLLAAGVIVMSFLLPAETPVKVSSSSPGRKVTLNLPAVAQVTLTPAPESLPMSTLVAAAMPTPRWELSWGEAQALREAIKEKSVSRVTDLRIGSALGVPGVGIYCEALKIPLGSKLRNLPWSDYCSMVAVFGTIYSGVAQKDLQDPANILIEAVPTKPQESTDENGNPVIRQGELARVTVFIKSWGILQPGYMPGDSQKYVVDLPNLYYQVVTDPLSRIFRGESVLFGLVNKVDTRSRELAEYDVLSDENLKQARHLLEVSLTESSGDPENPSIYDNLWAWFSEAAVNSGYDGLLSLTVVFDPSPGYYYLESLSSAGQPVGVHDYYDPSRYESGWSEEADDLFPEWREEMLKSLQSNH